VPDRSRPETARKRRPIWRRLIWILVLLLVIGGIAWRFHQAPTTTAPGFHPLGPLPVGVATVGTGKIDVTLNALGTVTALATATVVSQVTGQIAEVDFREGQDVKRGDLLVQIDPRPFQAALDQSTGQLLRDQALLKEAQVDLARYKTLASQNSIARQQAEDQEYVVEQDEGTVKLDEAMVSTARINLGYCRVVAPFSGHIGLRLIDTGNIVLANSSTGIAIITQLQPITVTFPLAEDYLPQVLKRMRGGAQLPVTVSDRSGATKLATGTLAAIDSSINTSTGTVNLKATFANDDEALFPNQFVNVTLLVDSKPDALTMPTAAIQRGSQGTFVYLVQGGDTVSVRVVKLGTVDGEKVEVVDGLKAGDQVVVDGADKLRDGTKVDAHNGAVTAPAAGDATTPGAQRKAKPPADAVPKTGQ
jgi:multidrug efflux system membrane fusion protein